MKERYIKQVKKELALPGKAKREVLRDLQEVFASALEHGETEQQVIQRLGTPREFADNTAEQFGIDNTAAKRRKNILLAVAAFIIAASAFCAYAAARLASVPQGVIGQADAMTDIQIKGAAGITVPQVFLAVGLAAAVAAALLLVRALRGSRR